MNNVTISGNLVKTPVLKHGGGKEYCYFTVAVHNRKNAANVVTTEFIDCTAFGADAQYLTKFKQTGHQVEVVGRITSRISSARATYAGTKDVVLDSTGAPILVNTKFTGLLVFSVAGAGARPQDEVRPNAYAPRIDKVTSNYNPNAVDEDAFADNEDALAEMQTA